MNYDGEPLFIYGTGPVGKRMYQDLTHYGIKITGFLDHLDRTVDGVPVWKLEDAPRTDHDVVVCAVMNYAADVRKIMASLKGFKRIVSVVEYCEYFGVPMLDFNFFHAPPEKYIEWLPAINQVKSLWTDAKSEELYCQIIHYRRTGDIRWLPDPDGRQYYPMDVPAWESPLRLMDCGAYDGDTLREFNAAGFDIEACVSFEPDPAHFSELAQEVDRLGCGIALPCGVAKKTELAHFDAVGDMSSRVSDVGTSVVQLLSIDECFPQFRPTLIKMDIEGAEMAALKGAENTIRKYRPGLAISVYHKPEDMWKIPAWVNSVAAYDFYLRVHSQSTFDTVMYAIPRED